MTTDLTKQNTCIPKPLLLLILDGWGDSPAAKDNAISEALTPHWDYLTQHSPCALLQTSGEAVGLPDGQMGNSEVGHMNIGAGRVVFQDLVRISNTLQSGDLSQHKALQETIAECAAQGKCVHVMGLLSAGGVHSHEQHLWSLLPLLQNLGADKIAIHAFLDGRDTPPQSAQPSLQQLHQLIDNQPGIQLASVSGRFYAMDRDKRWDRVQQSWRAMVAADSAFMATDGMAALEQAYARGENDEFVQPTVIGQGCGIDDGDVVLMFNFRSDRARQLAQAFVEKDFDGFSDPRPTLGRLITITEYLAGLPSLVLFPSESLPDLLGEVIANSGHKQLRIAETEKYAHVTFFFNGGQEQPFANEDRQLIPSPQVRTYDLQPEMSAPELTLQLVEAIKAQQYQVIICNVANADMVGHTGQFSAALQAVEAVDKLLGEVNEALQAVDGEMLITADHGNIEQMLDANTHQAHTAHTVNPVPLVYVGPRDIALKSGRLCDIAPTMLALLDIEQPSNMTGHCLMASD